MLNSRGQPEDARALFEAAFEAATPVGFDHLAIDALHMAAIVAPAASARSDWRWSACPTSTCR